MKSRLVTISGRNGSVLMSDSFRSVLIDYSTSESLLRILVIY